MTKQPQPIKGFNSTSLIFIPVRLFSPPKFIRRNYINATVNQFNV